MAAAKPAVSTPIKDVETLYGDVVRIARTPDEFIAACREALAETAAQRRDRLIAMQASVARSSWARTAETIRGALDAVLEAKSGRRIAAA
jgi:UDP-galactopyranose mutase